MTRIWQLLLSARSLFLAALALVAGQAVVLRTQPLCSADNAQPAARFALQPGDHIAIIGNTLADRMQHDGSLEVLFYNRFPKHNLVFRNLGFSGDELTLRLRSASFGSPDDWLTRVKADVVFAFFGYNESFGGEAGLGKFRKDLADFIQYTLKQEYNGKKPPRLVLFSPIAHENWVDFRDLPDGSENNKRLKLYTQAMSDLAKAHGVPFVDLFHSTLGFSDRLNWPLTFNGIHLTDYGNGRVAQIIDHILFHREPKPDLDHATYMKLREAVRDKNLHWFHRYRTVDGYSIFGGRADLKFVDGQTNRVVMQREMEVLDVMTGNRDKRIWAVAQGDDFKLDDSNTPPFIPVITNKPGQGPNGAHLFLGGEEAIRSMTVAKGMKVSLFASEKEFPELANPVQMTFDAQGRLWVAVWPTYPHWKPKEAMNDKILVLEDTDNDGKADKMTVFADGLHCPTGFELYDGGVLVAQQPDLVFLKDTDGDGKADVRQRVLHGLDSADTHHAANSFVLDPGGALYFQEGTFHHTQVETPYGPPERCANAGVFRYVPRTQKFEVYISHSFANPHGHAFDRWGQDIVVDGTGAMPYHAALFSGRVEFPEKHNRPPQVYQQKTRPCPGIEFLSSKHFPPEFQGNLLVANVIGFQGILRYRIDDRGASFAGTELEPILSSTDPNFRPSDLKIGPDGAIWFIDWHNPIIGHMQHNLRDPSRDREHGRIYRVTYEGRPLSKSPRIAGEPVDRLLDLLKEPEDRVRYRTRGELAARPTGQVLAAAKAWVAGLDPKDPEHQHHVLEALWLHQAHNVVDAELLKRVLGSPSFRARAAATRVLCYWRDRVPEALELLKKLAADEHPRVRLEAVRAASFFAVPEAIEIPLVSAERLSDPYLDFVRGETLRALDPIVKRAIAQKQPLKFTTAAGAGYFLKTVGTEDLLKMERTAGVYLELLFRRGVRDEHRREAMTGLAKLENRSPLLVLLDALKNQVFEEESVVFDLVRLLTDRPATELAGVRAELERMAASAATPVTRELGYVDLIAADGGVDRAWTMATKSPAGLQDLVTAMPLIRDAGQRAALYPKVEALLGGLPNELAGKATGKVVLGRYVRIELPGKQKTLTLAEVEVYSDGHNVALKGKASQSSTAHGGDAGRAIDGNKSGKYADGGQTHSQEGSQNPWWEVDLGAEYPIDSVVIWNRTDGNFGQRLKGFALKILNKGRETVHQQAKLAAPEVKATYDVGDESAERVIRRAAMTALTSVRGKETDAFTALAKFVADERDRHAAVQALLRIPTAHWPKEQARPLLDGLVAYVRKVPAAERTTPGVVDTLQFADSLASLLPLTDARAVRKELGELGVRVIRIGTLVEQMLYDKERIVVRAGRPVEIVLDNTDLMPHNLVITQPGALEEVGNLGEAQATQPGAAERQYVPTSKKILLASRLLQPRETQVLRFTAPTKPGVYPYVCTYPGHWRRMHGAMYVVEDLDEYLADPPAYLAKHPLPIADELLKYSRPRTEWKFEELAPALAQLSHGRSFTTGKQMFQVASCVACHKLDGAGAEFGPDLTKLDPKLQMPVEVLRDLLEPSFRINEKYQTYVFELSSGKTLTGIILEEKGDAVKVIENPLTKAEPLILKKAEIADRVKSSTSIMPKGLLDKLTREEILDLIAYVVAGGDAKHPLFQGGHEHGTGSTHH